MPDTAQPLDNLDLAVIGNCSFAALLDKAAHIIWCCLPRFDGDPVFNALLSGRNETTAQDAQGFFDVALDELQDTSQSYIPNTAVVVTRKQDANGGVIEIIDFAPRFSRFGRRYRPTAIIRIVRPLAGRPRVRVRLRPTFAYGTVAPIITHGSNHIRYVGPDDVLRLTTDAPLSYVMDETWFHLERPLTFWLGPDETVQGGVGVMAQDYLQETVTYWKTWVRTLAISAEWQEAVIRAAITLKLCWFEETGAIVAALTTSIPEAANSGRNWDYRYCWLRDSYYVVQALNRLGAIDIMESYLVYLRNLPGVSNGGHLQPVYGIALEHNLDEREVPSLAGYRGMGPVRVGNQAYQHFQFDVYGQVILSAAQAFFDVRLLAPATHDHFFQLEQVGEQAYAHHAKPDAGLWELRTMAREHTYTQAMCWAACDRLARIAAHLGLHDRAARWQERAATIRTWIDRECWNSQLNSFVTAAGGEDVDASLLELADLGFLSGTDPRFLSTLELIKTRLLKGAHVYRYVGRDDFGYPETAFNICTFWYIDALRRAGDAEGARAIYTTLLACRNHVGLLSEDIDVANNELWGNYPQTYAQVGIINCAMRLSKPWSAVI
jgi:GH15 family glucan-1,4-alpha-glucosidase